jgi:methyl-accepting chemotaxis protein
VQISEAMRNVDTVMEQNVSAARQSEETARALTDAAREMKLLVGVE